MLKIKRSTTPGCNDKRIRKLEYVASVTGSFFSEFNDTYFEYI